MTDPSAQAQEREQGLERALAHSDMVLAAVNAALEGKANEFELSFPIVRAIDDLRVSLAAAIQEQEKLNGIINWWQCHADAAEASLLQVQQERDELAEALTSVLEHRPLASGRWVHLPYCNTAHELYPPGTPGVTCNCKIASRQARDTLLGELIAMSPSAMNTPAAERTIVSVIRMARGDYEGLIADNTRLNTEQNALREALVAAAQFLHPDVQRGPDVDGWHNTVEMVKAALEGRGP